MSLGLEVTVCFLNLALDKVTQLLWAWVSTSYSHANPAWHCVCAPEGRTSPSSFQPGSYLPPPPPPSAVSISQGMMGSHTLRNPFVLGKNFEKSLLVT